jgi:hypothetical protein
MLRKTKRLAAAIAGSMLEWATLVVAILILFRSLFDSLGS